MKWTENNFFDHLDKFGNSLGYDNIPTAICLSMVPWQSTEDRDIFIMALTGEDVKGGGPSTFNVGVVK